jgi:MFS family permease
MATVFVDMIGFLMVLPLLPFYAERYGASPSMVGALVSTFAFAQLMTAPWWGRLSDRYGRRPMIIGGLLASGAAYLVFGLATSVWMLFLSRLIQGAGGGTIGVVQAYVADSVEREERAKALGWLTAATSAGVMVGPGIASLAAGWSPSAPGFLAGGLCLLNSLSAWWWLPESARNLGRTKGAGSERPPLGAALRSVVVAPRSPVAALIWIYAVGMMAFMAMNGILALFLERVHGVTTQTIGLFYMYVGGVSLLMRAVLLGPAVRWLGEVRVMRVGILALIVGFATIPLTTSIPGLALAAAMIPVGTALLFPATTSLVSAQAPDGETGQVLGVQQAFGGVSRLVGPLWAGVVFQFVGIRAPFWLCAALMGLVWVLARLLELDDREPEAPAGGERPVTESVEVVSQEAPS